MFTLTFWKAAFERALKTFAQTALAGIAVGAGFGQIDWIALGSVAGVATVASVLFSIASDALTGNGPSLTDSEQLVGKDEIVLNVENL